MGVENQGLDQGQGQGREASSQGDPELTCPQSERLSPVTLVLGLARGPLFLALTE